MQEVGKVSDQDDDGKPKGGLSSELQSDSNRIMWNCLEGGEKEKPRHLFGLEPQNASETSLTAMG